MRHSNRFAFLPQQRELNRAPILPGMSANREVYAESIRQKKGLPARKTSSDVGDPREELDLRAMKMPALKLIAKERGIEYKVGMTKDQLIAALEITPDEPYAPDHETIVVE